MSDTKVAGTSAPTQWQDDVHETSFNAMLAGLTADGADYIVDIPQHWLQDRTADGGLSATMTWTIDLLIDMPSSASGWWLVCNEAQTAAGACSAQDMAIWDDTGRPIAAMRQTVAVFMLWRLS